MTGERCAWCGEPALEQIEIQPGAYKTVTSTDPFGATKTAKQCTRLPVMAWACGRHRGLALDEPFRAPRQTKAKDVEQGSLFDANPRDAIRGDST